MLLRTLASRWNKQKFRCYEAKIEESEKAGSRRESNPQAGCPAQAGCPGFDSRRLPAFSLSSILAS